MRNRLTVMYRAGISAERVREIIGADDASIMTWDDVFAERDALRAEIEILLRDRDACIEVANRNAEDAMSLRAEVEQARRTAEHWKAEHLAGNVIIDQLRAEVDRLEQCMSVNEAALLRLGYRNACDERDTLAQRCREIEGALQQAAYRQQSDESAYSVVVQQNDTLRAEVERLRKDSARYRFLREQHDACGDYSVMKFCQRANEWLHTDFKLDAEIDRAMEASQ